MIVGLRTTIYKVPDFQKAKNGFAKVLYWPAYVVGEIEIASIKYFWNHVIERFHTPHFKLPSSS